MKRSKAYRRHQNALKYYRAYRILSDRWGFSLASEGELQELAGKLRDNLTACSCHMCRNPRRSKLVSGEERLTPQERRAQHIPDGQAGDAPLLQSDLAGFDSQVW